MELATSMESVIVRAASGDNITDDDVQLREIVSVYAELDKDRLLRQLALLPVR